MSIYIYDIHPPVRFNTVNALNLYFNEMQSENKIHLIPSSLVNFFPNLFVKIIWRTSTLILPAELNFHSTLYLCIFFHKNKYEKREKIESNLHITKVFRLIIVSIFIKNDSPVYLHYIMMSITVWGRVIGQDTNK